MQPANLEYRHCQGFAFRDNPYCYREASRIREQILKPLTPSLSPSRPGGEMSGGRVRGILVRMTLVPAAPACERCGLERNLFAGSIV
jgi:hypothetical protein